MFVVTGRDAFCILADLRGFLYPIRPSNEVSQAVKLTASVEQQSATIFSLSYPSGQRRSYGPTTLCD